jgi:hypothetical protein
VTGSARLDFRATLLLGFGTYTEPPLQRSGAAIGVCHRSGRATLFRGSERAVRSEKRQIGNGHPSDRCFLKKARARMTVFREAAGLP